MTCENYNKNERMCNITKENCYYPFELQGYKNCSIVIRQNKGLEKKVDYKIIKKEDKK